MRLRIHRGAKEIGGTCIEVEAEGKRLALDVGLPLDAPDEAQDRLLPDLPGFREPDDSLLGIAISHGHMDHFGLAKHVRPEVPVWIGEAAHNILRAASPWVPNGHAFSDPQFLADRTPVEIGPFRITPYLVDHSAFDAYALLVEAEGMHFVWTSSQNIDRIVTIFRAAKKTGRLLLIDPYTAVVLEATGRNTIPQSHWPEVRLYVPQRQRVSIKKNELFAELDRHSRNRVFDEALPALAERAVMLFRPMAMSDRGVRSVLDGAGFSYSMWDGYLKEDSSQRVLRWLECHGVAWAPIHTSGHASAADLQRFAAALAPRALVPIHSFETGRFSEFFNNVVPRADGEWWEV